MNDLSLQHANILTGELLVPYANYCTSLPEPQANPHTDNLLEQISSDRKQIVWIVHNILNPDILNKILNKITSCSRLVNILNLDCDDSIALNRNAVNTSLIQDQRLFVISNGPISEQVESLCSLIDMNRFESWKPLIASDISENEIIFLKNFYAELTPFLNSKAVNKITSDKISKQFLTNSLTNAIFTKNSLPLNDFKNLYLDKPALIVATGPSLNKQLDLLEQYKDCFIILAVDPAVPILKKRNIVPHFVFSIDPTKRPYWNQNELDDQSIFVVDICSCPDVAWSNNKKYITATGRADIADFMKNLGSDVPFLSTGGSVSTRSFNFALHIGANPIIMIGQDLAWTDGKDHAEGYVSQHSKKSLDNRHKMGFDITGYDGQTVRTERQLLAYKQWFEETIKKLPDKIIINATEGGALIEGAAHLPFNLVCKELSNFKFVPPPMDNADFWEIDLNFVNQYICSLQKILAELKTLDAQLNNYFKYTKNSSSQKNKLSRVDKLNQKLNSVSAEAKFVIEMTGQASISKSSRAAFSSTIMSSMDRVLEGYLSIYESTQSGTAKAIELISMIIALHTKILESQRFDPNYLREFNLHYWNRDGTRKISI